MASLPFSTRWLAALCGATLAAALPAHAQSSGDGFLFREPRVSLSLRGGLAHASAGSDIFSFTTRHLTLDRGDFSGPTLGGDLSVRLASRVDLALGATYTGTRTGSEYRDLVESNDAAIRQTTDFQRVPVTASLKAYLLPRGRTIGRFAWLPEKFAPYVGAGGGYTWYRFYQSGDFVDVESPDLDIFTSTLESRGWAPTVQAMGGVDVSLSPRFALTGETRYIWAKGEMSDSFEGFDRIDLSGLSATIGLSVRF